MDFNFIIIPAVIIATAIVGTRYIKQGLDSWYKHLRKPKWTPPGSLIKEIWIFLYITTALAVLWYWNVPVVSWMHYIVGLLLLVNAYLNATWNKVFFIEHDFEKSYQRIKQLIITAGLAAVLMFFASAIGSLLMLPYIIWLFLAGWMTTEIAKLNHPHN